MAKFVPFTKKDGKGKDEKAGKGGPLQNALAAQIRKKKDRRKKR